MNINADFRLRHFETTTIKLRRNNLMLLASMDSFNNVASKISGETNSGFRIFSDPERNIFERSSKRFYNKNTK